jgi:hypothetical protein
MAMKRRVIILVLLFLIVNITWAAYSFWGTIDVVYDDVEIPLGENAVISVSPTINPVKKMVPYGSFKGNDEIDEYVFNYDVTFNKTGLLRVTVPESSIKVGDGFHNFNSLAVVQIFMGEIPTDHTRRLILTSEFQNWNDTTQQYVMKVSIRVIIVAPSEVEDYDDAYHSLKGQPIRFNVIFEALEN